MKMHLDDIPRVQLIGITFFRQDDGGIERGDSACCSMRDEMDEGILAGLARDKSRRTRAVARENRTRRGGEISFDALHFGGGERKIWKFVVRRNRIAHEKQLFRLRGRIFNWRR